MWNIGIILLIFKYVKAVFKGWLSFRGFVDNDCLWKLIVVGGILVKFGKVLIVKILFNWYVFN